MKSHTKVFATVLVTTFVVGGGIGVYLMLRSGFKEYEVEGTITWIDAAAREVGFEFVSPRTGNRVELTSVIPPECEIQVAGQPAGFDALTPGTGARVRAAWSKRRKVVRPLAILVDRPSPPPRDRAPDSEGDGRQPPEG
jgi:hypothetical protein